MHYATSKPTDLSYASQARSDQADQDRSYLSLGSVEEIDNVPLPRADLVIMAYFCTASRLGEDATLEECLNAFQKDR